MATKEQKLNEAQEAIGVASEQMTTEKEYDLLSGFLKAAEVIKDETQKIDITYGGKLLFSFRIHAVTSAEIKAARKKATSFMPNPVNKKLPPIEKDVDKYTYQSYLIYLATVDSDRAQLWDNPEFKTKFGVMEGYELIDKVLPSGKKQMILDAIDTLSGYGSEYDEEEQDDIETAKNS